MILGQISYVDCVVFLICLIPQLLIQSNFFELIFCGLRALPFICKLYQLSIILRNRKKRTHVLIRKQSFKFLVSSSEKDTSPQKVKDRHSFSKHLHSKIL